MSVVERDLTWREALAAVLLLGAAGVWLWQAGGEQRLAAAVVWCIGSGALLLAAWGVARGIERLVDAVRRSTLAVSLMLAVFLAMPLQLANGSVSTLQDRLARLGLPLAWCMMLAGLLWPRRRAKATAETKPPAEPVRPADAKRRRRRMKRRRKG